MDFKGKIAFITGAANGAGWGQAQVFGRAGCRLFLTDVREDLLNERIETLRAEGIEANGWAFNLMDRDAFVQAADKVEDVYGEPPHLLFNTAGVFAMGPTEASTYEDFDWVMGVNYGGVVNGMVTFAPRMIKAKRPAHIVTTASLGGFFGADMVAIYSASKAAVVVLMEGYRQALAKYDIGVSVLCPMNINSNIALSSDTRPDHLKSTGYTVNDATKKSLQGLYAQGMDPLDLAEHVKTAINDNALYVLPYPDAHAPLEAHFKAVLDAVPPPESDPEGMAKRNKALMEWAGDRGSLFSENKDDASG